MTRAPALLFLVLVAWALNAAPALIVLAEFQP